MKALRIHREDFACTRKILTRKRPTRVIEEKIELLTRLKVEMIALPRTTTAMIAPLPIEGGDVAMTLVPLMTKTVIDHWEMAMDQRATHHRFHGDSDNKKVEIRSIDHIS